jgi:hypothetical protein
MYPDQVAADMTKTMTNTDEVLELVSELNSPAASLVILEQPASNRLRYGCWYLETTTNQTKGLTQLCSGSDMRLRVGVLERCKGKTRNSLT